MAGVDFHFTVVFREAKLAMKLGMFGPGLNSSKMVAPMAVENFRALCTGEKGWVVKAIWCYWVGSVQMKQGK